MGAAAPRAGKNAYFRALTLVFSGQGAVHLQAGNCKIFRANTLRPPCEMSSPTPMLSSPSLSQQKRMKTP